LLKLSLLLRRNGGQVQVVRIHPEVTRAIENNGKEQVFSGFSAAEVYTNILAIWGMNEEQRTNNERTKEGFEVALIPFTMLADAAWGDVDLGPVTNGFD